MRISALTLCILIILALFPAAAEESYVHITGLRADAPERLQGEYVTRQGERVSIDCAVTIPNVSACPVVRVAWGNPMEVFHASLKIVENNEFKLWVDHEFAYEEKWTLTEALEKVNEQSPNEAANMLVNQIRSAVPALSTQEFECTRLLSYRHKSENRGYYAVYLAALYHGIPLLCRPSYCIPLSDKDSTPIPYPVSSGCIEDEQRYSAQISVPKEIGTIEDDIPLLPFSEIQRIVEERIAAGYVASLDEMRLGYRIYIDPEHRGTEYVLLPVWIFSGILRGTLDVPFVDRAPLNSAPYDNMSSFVINAQTGEVYSFVTETSKERNDAPHILTWEETE